MTAIGELNKRMILQEEIAGAADGQGGQADPTWIEVDKVWAKLKPFSPRSEFYAQGKATWTLHWLTIRYMPGLSSANRFVYGARIFTPDGPPRNVDEKSEYLEFVVRETEAVTV